MLKILVFLLLKNSYSVAQYDVRFMTIFFTPKFESAKKINPKDGKKSEPRKKYSLLSTVFSRIEI